MRTEFVRSARRVVVKIGTSLLAGGGPGLDLDYLRRLVAAIATAREGGREVAIVSSGAIGAGLAALGMSGRPKSLRHLQAAAAIGQVALVHAYEEEFRSRGITVGQVLLTRDGVEDRGRYLNARNTLLTLMEEGAVPVVNENDTVSVEEIRIGDNDTLAALVTKLVEAELLLILTDVEGLCTSDPRRDDAALIDEVAEITPEIARCASGTGSALASGGMATKVEAARMATAAGAGMVLASGADPGNISAALAGEKVGTFFRPRSNPPEARKFWIAFASARSGTLVVNEGARRALTDGGKSLLPVGVLAAEGEFARGDTVRIAGEGREEFARGISSYGSGEVARILGRRSGEVAEILGPDFSEDEVVHRDNLVLL